MMKNKEWPDGSLELVSREAYDAVRRSRGYPFMSPEERLAAAQDYDRMWEITHSENEAFERNNSDPMEFTETAKGYQARQDWAERYDDLNGAPESDWDC